MRHANGPDAVPLRQPQRNLKQPRKHVYVFMTVQMRRLDSRVAHLGDLRAPLHLHFAHGKSACRDFQQQAIRSALELPRVVHQTRHRFARRDGWTIVQIQVHAHPEPTCSARQLRRLGERLAIRQQRRAGHNPIAMRLRDAAVHSRGPPEVIGIHDQVPCHLSRSFAKHCPLGQLYTRAPSRFRTIDPLGPQL